MVANPFLETKTMCLHFNHVRQGIAQTRSSASEMDEEAGVVALVLVCKKYSNQERILKNHNFALQN